MKVTTLNHSFQKSIVKPLFLIAFLISFIQLHAQSVYRLASPNGKLVLNVDAATDIKYTVTYADKLIIDKGAAALNLTKGKVLGRGDKVTSADVKKVSTSIEAVVAIKNKTIKDEFNELVLQFGKNYSIHFRAYNDAFAYRFVTNFKDSITINSEICEMTFPVDHTAVLQPLGDVLNNNYEHLYVRGSLDSISQPGKKTQLPFLVQLSKDELSLIVTEADVSDYPYLYFYSKEPNTISAYNNKVVKEVRTYEDPYWKYERMTYPYQFQPYIARTSGNRSFPWRVIAVAEQDKDLLNNEIVYKLSRASTIADGSWIKPGKVAWDWWNDWNFEKLDFKAGVNTATYKAYIDFAAKNKLEYIVMDEGWYVQPDLTRPINAIDMPELIQYGKEKNVDIILWGSWKTFNEQIDVLPALYQQWGIKGVKLDFVERDDQETIRLLEKVAKVCAEHKLLVDFHGCVSPTGLHRAYPNIVNYEGVKGLEQSKWGKDANPNNALMIPFIRMFGGPVDYTPGAMLNAQTDQFQPIWKQPMSQGTRCQQLAMYVVYEAPLQMLADNPSNYEKEQESTDFIAKVPTVWDETVPLNAKVGEYAVVARRNGNTWFVGAMTNWQERDIEVDLSFLPTGKYVADFFQDGINANKKATDYKRTVSDVSNATKLKVHLAKGGGCAMRISPALD